MRNSSIVPKRSATTVILNGAQRREESNASVRKTAMYSMNHLGFFAKFTLREAEGLRMTLVWGLVTSYAKVSLRGNLFPWILDSLDPCVSRSDEESAPRLRVIQRSPQAGEVRIGTNKIGIQP